MTKNQLCDVCSALFVSQQSLKEHKESIHEGIKYHGDQCEYKTNNRGNLIKHVTAVHEGISAVNMKLYYDPHERTTYKNSEQKIPCTI